MKIIQEKDLQFEESVSPEKLQEIMDSAIKSIKKEVNRNNGEAKYSFTVEGDTPGVNEYHENITFQVNFSRADSGTVRLERSDLLGSSSVTVKLYKTGLTFQNNVSGMRELSTYMQDRYGYPLETKFSATAVYGTIGRIFQDYFRTVPENVIQGVHFTTYHEGLVKPYIILSKEAEKKSGLVWAKPTRYSGQRFESFDLIRMTWIQKIKQMVQKK